MVLIYSVTTQLTMLSFNFIDVTVMFTEPSYSVVEGENYIVTVQLTKPAKTRLGLLINAVSIAAEGMYYYLWITLIFVFLLLLYTLEH